MRTLGLIPARGGSVGIPRKNIRPLAGRPCLAYTAEAALRAKRLARVVLSTDDAEIAEEGRRLGLDVPFLRPAELAGSAAPTLPVVLHALEWLEAHGDAFDAVCLLQPTSPVRAEGLIDACVEKLERESLDCVFTTLPIPKENHPFWGWIEGPDGTLRLATGAKDPVPRRQDLPPAHRREGSVYVTRRAVLETRSLYGDRVGGVAVDPGRSVNLDTWEDWARAEEILREERA